MTHLVANPLVKYGIMVLVAIMFSIMWVALSDKEDVV
jgi:hypothetical protein